MCLPSLGTLSAFKMLDASIVIHVAYNTTRDVRHDWHLLRHLASYPIALIPSPSYIPKHPVDCYYTYCSRSFVLLRSGSIHVSINTFFARQCCIRIVRRREIIRSIEKRHFFKRRRKLVSKF